jgi:hypothetical protein
MEAPHPQPEALSRVTGLLLAIATVAAELGPVFVHSEHGQQLLTAGFKTLAILSQQLNPSYGN